MFSVARVLVRCVSGNQREIRSRSGELGEDSATLAPTAEINLDLDKTEIATMTDSTGNTRGRNVVATQNDSTDNSFRNAVSKKKMIPLIIVFAR